MLKRSDLSCKTVGAVDCILIIPSINSESIRKARYTNQLNENYRDIGVAIVRLWNIVENSHRDPNRERDREGGREGGRERERERGEIKTRNGSFGSRF